MSRISLGTCILHRDPHEQRWGCLRWRVVTREVPVLYGYKPVCPLCRVDPCHCGVEFDDA